MSIFNVAAAPRLLRFKGEDAVGACQLLDVVAVSRQLRERMSIFLRSSSPTTLLHS